MQFRNMTSLNGGQTWFSTTSNLANEGQQSLHRERNRLKKKPPPDIFYSFEELQHTIRSQVRSTLRHNHSNANRVYSDHSEPQSRLTNQPSMKLQQQNESTSLYSQYELKHEELRRTRAKTPVFRIGQLENEPCTDSGKLSNGIDTVMALAQEYQAVLPPRGFTPCPQSTAPNVRRNGLRRVKCQDSLRDVVMTHPGNSHSGSLEITFEDSEQDSSLVESSVLPQVLVENCRKRSRPPGARYPRRPCDSHFTRRYSSDSETLLGSDSEPSPNSPILHYFPKSDPDAIEMVRDSGVHEETSDLTIPENDIGFQLCMDLLTNNLATALQRQHPLEPGSRVSGLQILLMIEAYESLQQKLNQEQDHVTERGGEHVSDVLDHWLHALRSIYEQSVSRDG